MKSRLLWALSVLAQSSHAITLFKRDSSAVVRLWFTRFQNENRPDVPGYQQKRDAIVAQGLWNEDIMYLYHVNLTVGSSGQEIAVVLDTGSSDTWFNIPSSEFCTNGDNHCQQYGIYDHTISSTYTFVNHDFNITYKDGTNAAGDFVKDTVALGGVTIKQFQFGIAEESTSTSGTMGLAFPALEVSPVQYPNFPQALVQAGHIRSAAYSLWMDEVTAYSGTILFGGVNRARYRGELRTIPLEPTGSAYMSLRVILTGLTLQQPETHAVAYTDGFPLLVALDSGASVTYLPQSFTDRLYADLGVTKSTEYNVPMIPCSMKAKNVTLTFDFSGIHIDVSIHELVLEGIEMDENILLCTFGIYPSISAIPILGDTFLRSAYVVYDLDNREVSMANTNFDAGLDDILEIGVGPQAVPSANLVSSPATSAVNMPTAKPSVSGKKTNSGAGVPEMDSRLLGVGFMASALMCIVL